MRSRLGQSQKSFATVLLNFSVIMCKSMGSGGGGGEESKHRLLTSSIRPHGVDRTGRSLS